MVRDVLAIPIVGTVPAIKPAAALTRTGTIGLLGTEATIRQGYVDRLEAEFAAGKRLRAPCRARARRGGRGQAARRAGRSGRDRRSGRRARSTRLAPTSTPWSSPAPTFRCSLPSFARCWGGRAVRRRRGGHRAAHRAPHRRPGDGARGARLRGLHRRSRPPLAYLARLRARSCEHGSNRERFAKITVAFVRAAA